MKRFLEFFPKITFEFEIVSKVLPDLEIIIFKLFLLIFLILEFRLFINVNFLPIL